MQSPNVANWTLSVRLGFLWAIVLPIIVAATITHGLVPDGCRQQEATSASEWWRWWGWPDRALAWLFVGIAAVSGLTALACVAKRVTSDTAVRVALWLSMGIGSLVWLLLNVVLFRSMHCSVE